MFKVPVGKRVHILPFEDSIKGIKDDIKQTYFIPNLR